MVRELEFSFQHYDTLSSTNDEAIELAKNGEPEGIVITADFQLKGRGREGRAWQSARGQDLLLSILLRPPFKINHISGLTLLGAEAVQETLAIYGVKSQIKRPNDVLVDGKKICGILTESQSKGDQVDWCVLGLGLNVNSVVVEIPTEATSLHLLLNRHVDLGEVKETFLDRFRDKYVNYV